jgi:hypothetical protein
MRARVGPASGKKWRTLFREECRVLGREMLEFVGQFIDGVNGVGGADRHAGSAIDAAVGLHIELSGGFELGLIFFRMNAVRGADVYAKEVLDAGVGDHIGHDEIFLRHELESCDPAELQGTGGRAERTVTGERPASIMDHADT